MSKQKIKNNTSETSKQLSNPNGMTTTSANSVEEKSKYNTKLETLIKSQSGQFISSPAKLLGLIDLLLNEGHFDRNIEEPEKYPSSKGEMKVSTFSCEKGSNKFEINLLKGANNNFTLIVASDENKILKRMFNVFELAAFIHSYK